MEASAASNTRIIIINFICREVLPRVACSARTERRKPVRLCVCYTSQPPGAGEKQRNARCLSSSRSFSCTFAM
ncbi:unnamed protein product [Ixodes persulcatus]